MLWTRFEVVEGATFDGQNKEIRRASTLTGSTELFRRKESRKEFKKEISHKQKMSHEFVNEKKETYACSGKCELYKKE